MEAMALLGREQAEAVTHSDVAGAMDDSLYGHGNTFGSGTFAFIPFVLRRGWF
jgi:hypothetical protein